MAAASSDVSGSKSGKGSARLATGGDYEWILGRYTKCKISGINLANGEPRGITQDQECDAGEELLIERLGDDPNGLTFQATFQFDESENSPALRYIYEGVGSYNLKYKDVITFYTDHVEIKQNGNWEPLNSTQASDVSTMRVSELDGDCSSVVADIYENEQIDFLPAPPFQYEAIATYLFTDVDSECE